MNTPISSYEQQAIDFLQKTGATIDITFKESGKYFDDDNKPRDIYTVVIKRNNRQYAFTFGNSIDDSGFYYTMGQKKVNIPREKIGDKHLLHYINKHSGGGFLNNSKSDIIHYPKAPTAYSVLSVLQKDDPGSFEDFCSEYGYDTDSRRAEKTYNAVVDEYNNLSRLFSDEELKEMQEIL